MDRWVLHRLQEVIRRVREAYEQYQFHVVYYTLYNFCTVDLSALYLDVLKDRLYTSKAASAARRSAQTAMTAILEAMVRLLAPILTFTAEEVWLALPACPGKAESVHLTQFPEVNEAMAQAGTGRNLEDAHRRQGRGGEGHRDGPAEQGYGPFPRCRRGHRRARGPAPPVGEAARGPAGALIVSDVRIVDAGEIGEAFRSAEIAGLPSAWAVRQGKVRPLLELQRDGRRQRGASDHLRAVPGESLRCRDGAVMTIDG